MNNWRNSSIFIHIFGISHLVLVHFAKNLFKFFVVVLLILSQKIEEGCWILRSEFLSRVFAKFFKIRFFRDQIYFFSPLILNLLEVDTLKLQSNFFKLTKQLVLHLLSLRVFWNYYFASFCKLKLNYTKCIFLTNWKFFWNVDLFRNHLNIWAFF